MNLSEENFEVWYQNICTVSFSWTGYTLKISDQIFSLTRTIFAEKVRYRD
jgi:hypothetical protein